MQSLDNFRKPDTNKSLGIEIECYMKDSHAPLLENHHGFFYATSDGSIVAPYIPIRERVPGYFSWVGREMVSQPLPASWLKKEIQKLFKKFPWEENITCGVHVHVSRKWLSTKKADKIVDFILSLGEGGFNDLFGRLPNEYCRLGRDGKSRYNAVNTTNEATIEFRMFRSGDAAWCCYCVDMVEYLIKNANQLNVDAIYAFKEWRLK